MAVEIDFTDEEATLVWCRGARAQAGFKKAVRDNDKPMMIYYGSWMAATLTQVADAAPVGLIPDGNETDKP